MAVLSNLMVRIGVDPDGVRRGVNKANRELDRMRDHTRVLSREMGRAGADGGAEFASGFYRDADGRLRDAKGRFAKAGEDIGGATGGGFIGGFGKVMKKLSGGASAVSKMVPAWAAMGSAILSLLPLLPGVVSGLASVVTTALAAAPALIGLGAGLFIVKTAFTAMFAQGTAARKALEPLVGMFQKATKAGSEAAAKGIKPLADSLRRVAQPIVTRFMVGLGSAANKVQRDFLNWAKSTDGLRTMRGILEPLAAMVGNLAPHVSALAIAFTRMLGRVMPLSAGLGQRGLAGAIDWLTKKLNGVKADQVANALGKISRASHTVIGVVKIVAGWIGKLVTAYRTYQKEFGLVADALSVVAIIFGGPVATIIAIAGLIIRHFDQLKAAWQKLSAAFKGGGGPSALKKAFADIKSAIATVRPELVKVWNDIKAQALPALKQLGNFIVTDLIPTLAEFVKAVAPVVAWLLRVWGPVAASAVKNLINMIRGALMIVSGIIKVFTAILTGDWGKAWQGVKEIVRGAVVIVKAWISQVVAFILGMFRSFAGQARAIWSRTAGAVVAAARSLINGAVSAIRGGIGRARSAASSVVSAVRGVFSGAGGWLVGAGRAIINGLISGVRSAIGGLRSLLNSVTSMIPDWKGPMRVDMKLLEPTGKAIMGGLTGGIRKSIPEVRKTLQGVTGDIPSYAAPRGVAQTGRGSDAPEIVIKSGGSRVDDALVDLLRRAVADRGGDVQRVLGR